MGPCTNRCHVLRLVNTSQHLRLMQPATCPAIPSSISILARKRKSRLIYRTGNQDLKAMSPRNWHQGLDPTSGLHAASQISWMEPES
jgi:hypothetical protein